MAFIDYMDPDVCCPKKAIKLNYSLTHWLHYEFSLLLLKKTQDMIQNVNSYFMIFKNSTCLELTYCTFLKKHMITLQFGNQVWIILYHVILIDYFLQQ